MLTGTCDKIMVKKEGWYHPADFKYAVLEVEIEKRRLY